MERESAKRTAELEAQIRAWAKRHNQRQEVARELQRAARRLGVDPATRLQWVLDHFVYVDLPSLRPEERVAVGYDLRGAVLLSLPEIEGITMTLAPITDAELLKYQRMLRAGVEGLLASPPRGWILPGTFRAVVASERMPNRREFAIIPGGGDEVAIVAGVARLVVETGERFRQCMLSTCGRCFVTTGSGAVEYCSAAHAFLARKRRVRAVARATA
jgi:hypothetical protein